MYVEHDHPGGSTHLQSHFDLLNTRYVYLRAKCRGQDKSSFCSEM